MVTDPPYGVEYDPAWRNRAGLGARRSGWVRWRTTTERIGARPGRCSLAMSLMSGTVRCTPTRVADSLAAYRVPDPGADHLGQGPARARTGALPLAARALPGMLCATSRRATGPATASRRRLWQIASRAQDADTVHGTQKPVECMRRPIENNSSPGQAVYEPFSGSGTTLIAAEQAGRACLAIELSPAYVDVAVLRWQAFTGQEAALDGERIGYAATAAARASERTR